ncbi:MAG: hypothetical protein HZA54_05060 [Planctomycetes bacterium]|nr:hypothetical protein [Planctomycetota bacterium]
MKRTLARWSFPLLTLLLLVRFNLAADPPRLSVARAAVDGEDVARILDLGLCKFALTAPPGTWQVEAEVEDWTAGGAEPKRHTSGGVILRDGTAEGAILASFPAHRPAWRIWIGSSGADTTLDLDRPLVAAGRAFLPDPARLGAGEAIALSALFPLDAPPVQPIPAGERDPLRYRARVARGVCLLVRFTEFAASK